MTLIHRYHVPLYKLAYRFAGSVEGAEDLCQEVLIRAYTQIRKFDVSRPFQPWIIRLASNVCLNWKQSEVKRATSEFALEVDLVRSEERDIHDEVFERMERVDMLNALSQLPNDMRLLVVMRFSVGLTLREIADQTGIKLPTVASRIGRGIDAMRQAMAAQQEVKES